MTFDSPGGGDPSQPFIVAATPKRKRRGGINYPLMVGAFAVLCIMGGWAYFRFGPHASLFATMQGEPSKDEAKTCLENHDLTCAEADYYAYLKLYPNDAETTGVLGIVLTRDGQHKEAISYYKRAVAMGVSTYDLYANYAISLNMTGDVEGAIKMNYAALQIAPSLVDVRGALADQLVKRGRAKEALNLLESFDRQEEDAGEPGYFVAQIAQIEKQIGGGAGAPGAGAAEQLAASEDRSIGAPGTSNIPLEQVNGALVAPVLVDGSLKLNFIVDSGASEVCIPGEIARTLVQEGKIGPADYMGSGIAILADGSRVPARLYRIHSMKIGDHEVHNVTASITNSGGPLLLGQSFLKRFKSWSIDNHRRVLVLQS